MRDKSGGFSVEEITNEKKLLKSVEGLISAIKSGQLVKEQENSSKRIQEILGSVLDKTSLSLLDPSFRKETSIVEEEDYEDMQEYQPNVDTLSHKRSSSLLVDTNNELKGPSLSLRHSAKSNKSGEKEPADVLSFKGVDANSENLAEPSALDLKSNEEDGYYLETERG